MNKRIVTLMAVPLAAMLSLTARAQIAVHGNGDGPDGAPVTTPSGAATVRTPGTPGAADTPGALMSKPTNDAPKSSAPSDTSSKPKSKKPASDSKDAPSK